MSSKLRKLQKNFELQKVQGELDVEIEQLVEARLKIRLQAELAARIDDYFEERVEAEVERRLLQAELEVEDDLFEDDESDEEFEAEGPDEEFEQLDPVRVLAEGITSAAICQLAAEAIEHLNLKAILTDELVKDAFLVELGYQLEDTE